MNSTSLKGKIQQHVPVFDKVAKTGGGNEVYIGNFGSNLTVQLPWVKNDCYNSKKQLFKSLIAINGQL